MPTIVIRHFYRESRARCRALIRRVRRIARRATCSAISTTPRSCGAIRWCARASRRMRRAATPARTGARSRPCAASCTRAWCAFASARATLPRAAAWGACTPRCCAARSTSSRCRSFPPSSGLSDRQVRRERRAAHDAFLSAFDDVAFDAPPRAVVHDTATLRLAEASELHEVGQSALATTACEAIAAAAPDPQRRIEALCLAAGDRPRRRALRRRRGAHRRGARDRRLARGRADRCGAHRRRGTHRSRRVVDAPRDGRLERPGHARRRSPWFRRTPAASATRRAERFSCAHSRPTRGSAMT